MKHAEIDLPGIYAPGCDEPLIVESVKVDIISRKIWKRDPHIYGEEENNKFCEPPKIKIDMVLINANNDIKFNLSVYVREISIDERTIEPYETN